jgi:hypothetical protein
MEDDSVHRGLERGWNRLIDSIFLPRSVRDSDVWADLQEAVEKDEATHLVLSSKTVLVVWGGLSVFSGLAMVAAAYVGHRLDGDEGRDVATVIGIGCFLFLWTGLVYAMYKSWFAAWAERRLSKDGPASEQFRRMAKRARLHNRSLIGQAAAGFAGALITIALLSG